jgi:hypothetical protein
VSRPIFQTDGFDEFDETTTHGAYIGGLATAHEDAALASSYKLAADLLVERALADDRVHEVVLPALFLYRHALELRLKVAVRPERLNHDLVALAQDLDGVLRAKQGVGLPAALVTRVAEMAQLDPRADGFRFTRASRKGSTGERHFEDEVWVDLAHVREEMAWIDTALQAAAGALSRA